MADKTYEEWLDAVEENGRTFVPVDIASEEFYIAAVGRNSMALRYMPEHLITEKTCLAAVTKAGERLLFVPKNFRTKEVCLAAVKNDGRILNEVPKKHRTEELCLAAVSQNGEALKDVPEPLKTTELCFTALLHGAHINMVPPSGQPQIKAMLADNTVVKYNGFVLEYTREELKTRDVCMAAVLSDPRALEFVPEKFKTPDFFLEAVKQDRFYIDNTWEPVIARIPKECRTREICLESVRRIGRSIRHVPKEFVTEELCLLAVRGDGEAPIPDEFKTVDVCFAAMKQLLDERKVTFKLKKEFEDLMRRLRATYGYPEEVWAQVEPMLKDAFSAPEAPVSRTVPDT